MTILTCHVETSGQWMSGQINGQLDEWNWWTADLGRQRDESAGWSDVLPKRLQTTRTDKQSSRHNVIAVLTSGRTVGWRSTCDKLQITGSCLCWPECVTTRHARRNTLFYVIPCVTTSHRAQLQYFVGHRRTSAVLQWNLVQQTVQVRTDTFLCL